MDHNDVIANTPVSSTFLIVPVGTAKTDIAEITSKLNAADPTIVEGPSSPGVDPRVYSVSITERRISGALDPNAIKVRFAIVGFQTVTVYFCMFPSSSSYGISLV